MNILTLVLFVLAAVLFALQIKAYNKPIALVLSLAAGIAVFLYLLTYLQDILTVFQDFFQKSGLESAYYEPLIKATGIALIVKAASAVCRDAGEQALAYKMELAGTTAIILTAFPLFSKVLHLVTEII